MLALAGGAGIVLYFALWVFGRGHVWIAAVLGVLAIAGCSKRSVFPVAAVAGATLVLAGLFAVLSARRLGSARRSLADRSA